MPTRKLFIPREVAVDDVLTLGTTMTGDTVAEHILGATTLDRGFWPNGANGLVVVGERHLDEAVLAGRAPESTHADGLVTVFEPRTKELRVLAVSLRPQHAFANAKRRRKGQVAHPRAWTPLASREIVGPQSPGAGLLRKLRRRIKAVTPQPTVAVTHDAVTSYQINAPEDGRTWVLHVLVTPAATIELAFAPLDEEVGRRHALDAALSQWKWLEGLLPAMSR